MAKKSRPAKTPDARENQLINLAMDEAERRIRDGTATSQLLSIFLKLGSSRERLEQEKLRRENELTNEKIETLRSAQRIEQLYKDAMSALSVYRGNTEQDEDIY